MKEHIKLPQNGKMVMKNCVVSIEVLQLYYQQFDFSSPLKTIIDQETINLAINKVVKRDQVAIVSIALARELI